MKPHFLQDFEMHARQTPTAIAIECGKETVTYGELLNRIQSVAAGAIQSGARPGDRFLYAARPTPQSIAYALGLLRAGLTLVFVDPFSAAHLFESRAKLVNPRYVVADSLLYLAGSRWFAPVRRIKQMVVCDYSNVRAEHLFVGRRLPGVPRRSRSIRQLLASGSRLPLPVLDPDADAIIVFTSGTTTDPKAVVHSLNTLSANANSFADLLRVAEGQVVFAEPLTVGMLALTRGSRWVLPDEKTPIPQQVDVLFAVPTDVRAILSSIENDSRTITIRQLATGGAPVLDSLVRRVDEVLGPETRVWSVYGMTEILPIAACDARRKQLVERGDLLGELLGDTQVQSANDHEILVRGSGLMKGYLGRELGDWHATGDLGYLDPEHGLVMLGRKKNMLIRGHKNIYPSLYEPAITRIAGVAAAHLLGVPDDIGDDRVVLIVSPEIAEVDLQGFRAAVERNLPGAIDGDAFPDCVVAVRQIPISGRSNKPDIAALKAIATSALEAL